MIRSLLRLAAGLLLFFPAASRAQTLETLLAPAVAAALKRAAAQLPPGERPSREELLQSADASMGIDKVTVLVLSEALLREQPADANLRRARASLWLRLAQPTRALAELQPLSAQDARAPEVALLRARILQFQGDLPAALAAAKLGAVDDSYFASQARELAATLAALQSRWAQAVQPLLARIPATADGAAARAACEVGAFNLAHAVASAALERNAADTAARQALLDAYASLELPTPALRAIVARRRAPLAAAYARRHPQEENVWRTAVACAAEAVTAEGPNEIAFLRSLLRDAQAAGQEFPAEQCLLEIIATDDPAALARLAETAAGPLAERPDYAEILHERRLLLQPDNPGLKAVAAARAQANERRLWLEAFRALRPEIESDRLPARVYEETVAAAAAAGHAFPAEAQRARLYAADSDLALIEAVRDALPATREQPDLDDTIDALLRRRILAVRPDSLGFFTNLTTDTPPAFDESTYLPAGVPAAMAKEPPGLGRVRLWVSLGAPASALTELDRCAASVRATPEAWILRAQLLHALGRYPEGLLAIDRARFLAGRSGLIENRERLDGVAVASLHVDLLASAQSASRHIAPLEEQLQAEPDNAALWGRLALAWIDQPLHCIPKAAKAAARARALVRDQPEARRAEFEALRLQAQRVPADIVGELSRLLLDRIEQFPPDDWSLRLRVLRSLPYQDRGLFAAHCIGKLKPQSASVPDGHLLLRLFKVYTLASHEEVEDWIDDMGGPGRIGEDHLGRPEMDFAVEIDHQMNERRGWFTREPGFLFEEEIDERNAAADAQFAQIPSTTAAVWAVYEQLRLRSINEAEPDLESTETSAHLRQKLWQSGRHGPPHATPEVNPECVPYYPGLTSRERELALECVRRLLSAYGRGDHARLSGQAYDLLRRLQIRPRQLKDLGGFAAKATGYGDFHEFPEIAAATAQSDAGNLDQAEALIRPLLARGVVNYYVACLAGRIANARSQTEAAVRFYSQARVLARFQPALAEHATQALAIVKGNQASRIRARLAAIDERMGYLARVSERTAELAAQAAANMDSLARNMPTVTLFNADRIQYDADRYALQASNAENRIRDVMGEVEELRAERARLIELERKL